MRPLTRLYYGAVILSMFSVSPPETPDQDLSAPTVAEFTAAIAEGRLSPTGRDTLYVLAKMCLAGALEAARAPGFDEALKAASG
jgi:hypothetical protein